MKAGLLAVAAGVVGSASAFQGHKRHEHAQPMGTGAPNYPAFPDHACCKSVVTVTVPYGGIPSAAPMKPSPPASSPAPVAPVKPSTSPVKAVVPVPTPEVTTCPTPGVYTIPAKTVVVTETTTVCAATTTPLSPGKHTYGGVTTVVTTSTTVTCPYAAIETSGGTTTTVVKSTTFVCPSAGTYTPVAPTTTSVDKSTVLVYPVPATYTPGTYTHPAQTVTVTETDFVFVCPLTASVIPAPAAPTSKPSGAPAAPAVPTLPAAPALPVVPAVAAPKPYGGNTGISVNGKKWAITYTPYTVSGQCKTPAEVHADIAIIAAKGFTTVRLYATDCDGLINVGAACKAVGLKMIIGVFIKADGIEAARPQVKDIVAWGKENFGIVSMIVIGNEALFNGYCSPAALAAFIAECKAAFAGAGYTGPVTTTEPLSILQAHGSDLCSVIDVIAGNVQPFFNSGIDASHAGDFVKGQLKLIGDICPGLEAYNLECGWPSAGNNNGKAVAGVAEQAEAIKDIIDKVGERTVIFSFHNDDWKDPGQFDVERNFGCSQLF